VLTGKSFDMHISSSYFGSVSVIAYDRINKDVQVPISVVNENIHFLPGVTRLFVRMLTVSRPSLLSRLTDPESKGVFRVILSTPLPKSGYASYLTRLVKKDVRG
jgi:hypothetical protein